MTNCTAEHCTETGKTMIARKHGPDSCPAAPPKTCEACGQVKPEVPALLVVGDD